MHNINTKQSSFNGYLSTIVDVYSDIKELIGSNQLTISFNSMGGSAVSNIHVYMQQSFGELPKPEKTGYVFKGWYRKVTTVLKELLYDDADLVEDFSYVNDTTDLTLYARWEAKLLKISFVSAIEEQDAKFSPPELYVKYLKKFKDAQPLSAVGTHNEFNFEYISATAANYEFDNRWAFNFKQTLVDISASTELTSLNYYGLNGTQYILVDTTDEDNDEEDDDEEDIPITGDVDPWEWKYENNTFVIKPKSIIPDDPNASYLVRFSTLLSTNHNNYIGRACTFNLSVVNRDQLNTVAAPRYCIGNAYPISASVSENSELVALSCFAQTRYPDIYNDNYFYTASSTEADTVAGSGSWKYIGTACYVYLTNNEENSRIPIYRLHRKSIANDTLQINAHYYSGSQEAINDKLNCGEGWVFDSKDGSGTFESSIHFYLDQPKLDDSVESFGVYLLDKSRSYTENNTTYNFKFFDILMISEYDNAILGAVYSSNEHDSTSSLTEVSCFKYIRDTNLISNNYFYTANSDEANNLATTSGSKWEYISSDNFFAYPSNLSATDDSLIPVYRLWKHCFDEKIQNIALESHYFSTSRDKIKLLLDINDSVPGVDAQTPDSLIATKVDGKLFYTVYLASITGSLAGNGSVNVSLTPVDYIEGIIPVGESQLIGNIASSQNINAKLSATITLRQKIDNRINDAISVVLEQPNQTFSLTNRSIIPLFIPSGENISKLTDEYIEYKNTVVFSYFGTETKFFLYVGEDAIGESFAENINPILKRVTTTDLALCKIEINSMEYNLNVGVNPGLPASEVNDIQIYTNNDITLSGIFSPLEYEISYDINGGTFNGDEKFESFKLRADSSAELAPLSQINELVYKTGYTAEGWSYTPGNPNVIDVISYPTSDHTYYLFWKANTYTITYTYEGFLPKTQTLTYNSSDYLLPFASMSFSYVFPEFAEWYCPELNRTFKDGQLVNNLTPIPNMQLTFEPARANQSMNITGGKFDITKVKRVYNPGDVFNAADGTLTITYQMADTQASTSDGREYSTTFYNIGLNENIEITDSSGRIYSNGKVLTYPNSSTTEIKLSANFDTGNATVISTSYTITCYSVFNVVNSTKLSADITNFKKIFLPGDTANFSNIKLYATLSNSYYNNSNSYQIKEIPISECQVNMLDNAGNSIPVKQSFDADDVGERFSYIFYYTDPECSCNIDILVANSMSWAVESLSVNPITGVNIKTSYFEDTEFNINNYNISAVYVKADYTAENNVVSAISSLSKTDISYEPMILRLNGATTTQTSNIIVSYTYNSNTITAEISDIGIKPRNIYLTATTDLTFLYPGMPVDLSSFSFKRRDYENGMESSDSTLTPIEINEYSSEITANWKIDEYTSIIDNPLLHGVITFDNCKNGLVFSNNYEFIHALDGPTENRKLTYTMDISAMGIAVIPELCVNYISDDISVAVVGQEFSLSDFYVSLTYYNTDYFVNVDVPDLSIELSDVMFTNNPEVADEGYLRVSNENLDGISVSYDLNGEIYNNIVNLEIKPVSITAELLSDENLTAGSFLPLSLISADLFLPTFIGYDIFNTIINSSTDLSTNLSGDLSDDLSSNLSDDLSSNLSDIMPLNIDNFVFRSKNDSINNLITIVNETTFEEISGIILDSDMMLNGLIIEYDPEVEEKGKYLLNGYASLLNTDTDTTINFELVNMIADILSSDISSININININNIESELDKVINVNTGLSSANTTMFGIISKTDSDNSYNSEFEFIINDVTIIANNIKCLLETSTEISFEATGINIYISNNITINKLYQGNIVPNEELTDDDKLIIANLKDLLSSYNFDMPDDKPIVITGNIQNSAIGTVISFGTKSYDLTATYTNNYNLINSEFDISKLNIAFNYNGTIFNGSLETANRVEDESDENILSGNILMTNDYLNIEGALSVYNLGYSDNNWVITDTTLLSGLIINYETVFNGEQLTATYTISPSLLKYPKVESLVLNNPEIILQQLPGESININDLKLTLTTEFNENILMTLNGSATNNGN